MKAAFSMQRKQNRTNARVLRLAELVEGMDVESTRALMVEVDELHGELRPTDDLLKQAQEAPRFDEFRKLLSTTTGSKDICLRFNKEQLGILDQIIKEVGEVAVKDRHERARDLIRARFASVEAGPQEDGQPDAGRRVAAGPAAHPVGAPPLTATTLKVLPLPQAQDDTVSRPDWETMPMPAVAELAIMSLESHISGATGSNSGLVYPPSLSHVEPDDLSKDFLKMSLSGAPSGGGGDDDLSELGSFARVAGVGW